VSIVVLKAKTHGSIRAVAEQREGCRREDSVNKISIALLLGAVFAVGCGDAEKGTGSGSAKASSAPSTKSTASGGATGSAAAAGGSYDDYIKAVCDCKGDMKCIGDAGIKYQDTITKNAASVTPDQAKKLTECTAAMAPGGMPSGAPSAAGSAK